MDSNFRSNEELNVPSLPTRAIVVLIVLMTVLAAVAFLTLGPAPKAEAQETEVGSAVSVEVCHDTSGYEGDLACYYEDGVLIHVINIESEVGHGLSPDVAMFDPWKGAPDALTASGLSGDPALLPIEMAENKSGLSSRVRDELERVRPLRIEVLGGDAVVSNEAMLQIAITVSEARTDRAVDVRRTYGNDRVGTMLEVSRTYIPDCTFGGC